MRALPPALQTALDGGATTLARCWRLARRDGAVLGFTDHDLPLSFEGVTYEPDAGFQPSAIDSGLGLAADTHDVAGALSSDCIAEADVAKGLYDGAEVTLYLVDWRDVANRAVLSRGLIGQIRRGTLAFEAEITGLADRLNQPTGAAYLPTCSARLGDQVCGVDLTDPPFRGTATASAVAETQRFTLTGLAAYADGWFAGGAVTWLTGANAGLTGHVKSHVAAGPEAFVELWLSPPLAVLPGDTLEITAGCDKTLDTCIAKFGNVENFCGMPHMPGDDVAARYPNSGERHDGGSLFKT